MSPAPLTKAVIPLSLALFICPGSILAKPKVCILTFSNTRRSYRTVTDVSFSVPHLLHEGVFALLILCNMYCRLLCSVRSPTNILPCSRSSLLMNWTYLSVGPSRQRWLVQYFHRISILSVSFHLMLRIPIYVHQQKLAFVVLLWL